MTTKQPDWEAIERAYRAGLLSIREIASAHGITHGAINKRAKRDGWERDLKAKIKAKADALVSKRSVSTAVSTKSPDTEREIIELNAEVIANIRMAHRGDISRGRRLTNKLLDELESLTDNRDLFDELGELMREPDDNGQDKRNDLYQRIIDLPGRTKTMKELAETLKTLVALERQAYDLDVKQGGSEEDTLSKLMDELSKDA
ncbi:hypothetical protein [Pseudomonas fulva]|uniref:hypothetical protein n=1 Tax=Pseudomonas fulva TaxID=47880 RepID=UPI00191DE5E1|nr:hypothetical protein [Pseudomonas fulva]MBN4165082.1 hypothetical protein [Pseudomonas fulva]